MDLGCGGSLFIAMSPIVAALDSAVRRPVSEGCPVPRGPTAPVSTDRDALLGLHATSERQTDHAASAPRQLLPHAPDERRFHPRANVRWSRRAIFGGSLRSLLFDSPAAQLER